MSGDTLHIPPVRTPYASRVENEKNFPEKLASWKKELEDGNCYIFTKEKSNILFHKCIKDPKSDTEKFQEVSLDKIKIYRVVYDSEDVHFDVFTFDKLRTSLLESGYQCRCDLVRRLKNCEQLVVCDLELEPVMRLKS